MSEKKDLNKARADPVPPPVSESSSEESGEESSRPNVAPVRPQASSSSSSYQRSNGRNPHSFRSSSPCSSKSGLLGKFHRNEKFTPNEDLVKQIMDMGICRNGAVKALYWTGNQSALAASNWIFDQPDRDLDTPLEDELEMIRAQQAEREREDMEEREFASHMCRMHHHAMMHHHDIDSEDIDEEDLMEEEEEDEDDEDEDIDDEDEDMEFKMVFVVNKSLDLKSGVMSLYVAKATAGLFRKINSQPQSVLVGPDELSMWGDLGEKMIVLSGENDQHMKDLELMAKNLRLPCHMIDVVLVSEIQYYKQFDFSNISIFPGKLF